MFNDINKNHSQRQTHNTIKRINKMFSLWDYLPKDEESLQIICPLAMVVYRVQAKLAREKFFPYV